MTTNDLIQERRGTHGLWEQQAAAAQALKDTMLANKYSILTVSQLEALEMIAVKISRILTGDPSFPDHWDDIAGYAMLGKQGHE